jgi:CDP-paratose 2-epimerase
MSVCLVTGSAGLIGSEATRQFAAEGYTVVGVDNDMRSYFFGPDASTAENRRRLESALGDAYQHEDLDIRDESGVNALFGRFRGDISVVVHTAAQPSHDWAAREPQVDFGVNAVGTLNLLEATRHHAPDAAFLFTSTNKVYGDAPNRLPLQELEQRWELPEDHDYWAGIPEGFTIDQSLHSLFGASKVAADILVQEYGRYFGMNTVCFRGGCLTGGGHMGAELHGFLAYLMRCTLTGTPYRVFGYGAKQVRDNIHSSDLVRAFRHYVAAPRPSEVYNIGGGRAANCSMLEAIHLCQELGGRELNWSYVDENRVGDHMWWISDLGRFRGHYPAWDVTLGIEETLREIMDAQLENLTVR